jgi:pimeloyl-ACP methyl ester carboxylesterase
LNLDKLILGGHSFGGMTAVYTAREDSRVKCIGTLDPWLFAHHKEILAGDFPLEVPHIAISTEYFHPSLAMNFPTWETLKTLLSTSRNPSLENIIIKRTGHLHQCDLACLTPLELFLMAWVRP